MAHRRDAGGRALTLAVVAALALGLTPDRYARVASWLTEPVAFLVQPIAHPVARLTRWLRPGRDTLGDDDPRLAALLDERDRAVDALRRAELRIDRLEAQVRDLQSGVPVAPGARLRQVWAPVTSRSSVLADGTIRLGVGRDARIEPGVSVATVRGVALVGRVVRVEARTCWALPFTHPRAGPVEGVVLTGPTLAESFGCLLEGAGDGTLTGDMVGEAVGVEPGMVVRLRDEAWPEIAQMLVLGRVESVERKENGRLRIAVRPAADPARVSEVVIRVPETRSAPAGEAP
ncbi:MAG: hypothetical protein D6693_02800 [Planctomycetota bacterium]|nr:MAG: hypothetical protein D6693_02800 [Planctomycetota bacterium]